MPHIEVQPNGQIEFVRSSKPKSKPAHKHHVDSRDQKIADLQRELAAVEEQKQQIIVQYENLRELKNAAVEDARTYKQAASKFKKTSEDAEDQYEDLQQRFDRKAEELKHKDKVIRQRDSEIRSKDKEIEECRVDRKVQSGTIKQMEDRNAALQDRVTTMLDEKRRLQQEVTLRRAKEEKLLADNKNLTDVNTRLQDWVAGERQLAMEREARLRREREDAERRDAERRAPPRGRRFDDDRFF